MTHLCRKKNGLRQAEPIERLWVAAKAAGVPFVTPRPGAVMDMDNPPAPERWWPEVPWQTAEEAPIIATRRGDLEERYEAPEVFIKAHRRQAAADDVSRAASGGAFCLWRLRSQRPFDGNGEVWCSCRCGR